MDFGEVVGRRRMVRDYQPDRPVPPEVVDRLLAHAVRAPSAGFSQGWAFLVLEEHVDRERFWTATTPPQAPTKAPAPSRHNARDQAPSTKAPASSRPHPPPQSPSSTRWLAGMRRAPLIVAVHSHKDAYLDRYAEPDKGWTDRDEARWPVPYWHIDAGFAALMMLLTAVDECLGACFFGIPPERTGAYRDAFGVPVAYTPIGAITVGYPAEDWRSPSLRRGRRPMGDVVYRSRWT
jgi:nitroreductase